jgi:hypothetical protein
LFEAAMLALRGPALVLVAALAVVPAFGSAGPVCADCCPAPSTRVVTISSLGCCGDGCVAKLAAAQDRTCLVSHRTVDVAWNALPSAILSVSQSAHRDDPLHVRFFWLPTSARPGTTPLRL